MSAPGLRPLAPVYLLTSFFKISHKSLPRKHNGQHFSAGVKRKQNVSFPCPALVFWMSPSTQDHWQACSWWLLPGGLCEPHLSFYSQLYLAVLFLSPTFPGYPKPEPSKAPTFSFSCSFSYGIILQLEFLGSLCGLLRDCISFQPPDLISPLTPSSSTPTQLLRQGKG